MTKIEEYRSWASACVARMDEIVKDYPPNTIVKARFH